MTDYLNAYRATGRPPPPSPAYPTDPAARAAQGLPPLFAPAPFPGSAGPSTSTSTPAIFGPAGPGLGLGGLGNGGAASTSAVPPITDPARLPLPQTFAAPVAVGTPVGVGTGTERELFTSVAASPEYSHWSHEELRYHAYLRGMRAPPPGTPAFNAAAQPIASTSAASTSSVSAAAPGTLGAPTQDGGDTFMTITTRPEFAGHSVEVRLSARLDKRAGTNNLFTISLPVFICLLESLGLHWSAYNLPSLVPSRPVT
ncbi:hypothetical protein B0H14DRAFT_1325413 [Mycena olivaceomarginata]|nr:hypothetical protein B0H14DRAFT_1325413 [Mycena olivaceomarginata]